jgi:cell division protein ZapA (FtsZ GTPase activity inhibitor)
MKDDLLKVNILGVNLTLKSSEDATQLKQVIWFLNKKIDETREKHKSVDQLKLSILTSIYIVDELITLKNSQYSSGSQDAAREPGDRLVREEAERTLNRVLEVLESTVNEE